MSEYNNRPDQTGGEYNSGSLNREYARNSTYDAAANSPYRSDRYDYRQSGDYNSYKYYSSNPVTPEEPPRKKREKHTGRGIVALCICLSLVFGFAGSVIGNVVSFNNGKLALDTDKGATIIYQQVNNENTRPEADTGSVVGDVAFEVQDTVVSITTESLSSNPFMPQYIESGAGSGVIISEDGYIVTCDHVITGADNLIVTLYNGEQYNATVVGSDPSTDTAVIKIKATGLKSAVIGSSDELKIGETAIAIGNPLGTLGHSVSSGIVSALERKVTVQGQTMILLQTDAAVNPGNSGGGLFDADGNLIGIVNAKSSADGVEGIGFAIPISNAMPIVESIMQNGYVTGRPGLGVTVVTISDAATAEQYGVSRLGVYVYELFEGGPAEQAGVKVRDCFVSADGVLIEKTSDLTDYLASCEIGDVVKLQLVRDGKLVEIDVTLGELQ